MKGKLCLSAVFAAALAAVVFTGCGLLDENAKKTAHQKIIEYAETKGQAAVIEYVDQQTAEGNLTEKQAQKIKDALPKGIDKLREVMGETENNETEGN